jgi:hypothetical protein
MLIVRAHSSLYIALGKPYLASTEGNEHCHQEMKKFFHTMCSHNSKKNPDVLQYMNLHAARRTLNSEHIDELPRGTRTNAHTGMQTKAVKRGGAERKARCCSNHDFALEDTKDEMRRRGWTAEMTGDMMTKRARTELLDLFGPRGQAAPRA